MKDDDKVVAIGQHPNNNHQTNTHTVTELPASLIKALMRIAETCVIKSNRISRDETPDFVQNCLLKLLVQIEQERVVVDEAKVQYYVIKKDGRLLEIERWFGTTATNISIDHYRRIKNQVDTPNNHNDSSAQDDIAQLLVPEPSTHLESQIRQQHIQTMSQYCAEALDICIDETWHVIAQDNYKNFSLEFADNALSQDKGVAVASYCQITLEEKYSNDGKKLNSHDTVCKGLGIIIRPENIAHKKKKFEQLMMKCVTQKVEKEFNNTAKQTLQDDINDEV